MRLLERQHDELLKDNIQTIAENKQLREALEQALLAILYTRDYVGESNLPEVIGWSWYDAITTISELIPESDAVQQFKLRIKKK
jgi:hypothetical protein